MKGKKRIIVTLLFFINIIMLVAAVIPHHHHPNGMICMKQDLPVEQQCPTHHHHPGNKNKMSVKLARSGGFAVSLIEATPADLKTIKKWK